MRRGSRCCWLCRRLAHPSVAWRKKWTEGTAAACGVEATSVVVATEAAKAGQAAREEAARVGAAAAKTEVVTSSAAVAS